MVELLLLLENQLRLFTFTWLLLLPAIAAILIFHGTWLDNGNSARGRSKKYRRRLRARVLIHRALIVNLLLSGFIVSTSSLTVLPDVVQGLVLAVLLMIPVLIYILISVLEWSPASAFRTADPVKQQALPGSTRQATDTAFFDQTLSVEEQMHHIDRSVNHVDIAAEKLASISAGGVSHHQLHTPEPEQSALSAAREMVESDHDLCAADQTDLPARRHGELTKMVADLQKEKLKLQKLVIAQKAVIENERQRKHKAPVLTQETMATMRKVMQGARGAVSIAQRERRERLRLEADNAKIRKQLENAMSAKHNKKRSNGQTQPGARGAVGS